MKTLAGTKANENKNKLFLMTFRQKILIAFHRLNRTTVDTHIMFVR